jgi:site-specific DNA-methyltransferase (adenine-specific)
VSKHDGATAARARSLHGGRAVLHHAEALAALTRLPAGSVDAIVSDPPYSSGGPFRSDREQDPTTKYVQTGLAHKRPSFAGDNRDQRSYLKWCTLWLAECLRVAKKGAPVVIFSDWRQLPIMSDALQAGGWVWRGVVPWNKTEGSRPRIGGFRTQCEYALWGSNGPFPPRPEIGALPGLVTAFVRQSDKFHIAGKPTTVMQALVSVCDAGGVVLDPFMGSGTTGVAALTTGRRFVGIECDRVWFDVAAKRLASTQAA